jgi:long-chain acyl-CoA synthetase
MSVLSQIENVAEYLLQGKSPKDVALLTLAGQHTYGELEDAVVRVANYLQAAGGQKGDRVLLSADNSFFWVSAYLGILRSGLVCVPMPITSSELELGYAVQVTEARFAFLQNSVAQRYAELFSELSVIVGTHAPGVICGRTLTDFSTVLSDRVGQAFPPASIGDQDLAALMFTSGSTGVPRAVMVSHANIKANTDSIIECLGLSGSDRIMDVLPFHYCFGTSLLHTHLRVGGTVVIDGRFMYPEKILDRMIETECTGFAGVPSHYQILLNSTGIRNRSFPRLRYLQQAGGHLATHFIQDLRVALPDTKVFIMYGQTEATARLSYVPPERLDEKVGSIGKGIPGVKLRVLNESGQEVGPGETGEVVAEGGNVTLGYWRDVEETDKCFRQRRLYTGDLATVDDEGFIYVVDRAKDFLKCGGKRVSCRQLEQQILEFEGLVEAAVIGIPDGVLGEAVKAFVVPQSPHADLEKRLQAFCKLRMAPQFVPREICVLGSLPKNSAGKVAKQALKAL